ncbi:MAG TPA: 16S rRNA (uracil(1498)-N(3))-methyltransferase [Candidatus Scybalousia intestinigallinarum]|nr:16S rRNA (uracil(1498)-N(3))-methyltransferase [Candidatus Scybalousia intestinigallinarum]
MQRYFVENIQGDKVILCHEDSYHIKRVMRMKLGEKIELVYQEKAYLGQIESLDDQVQVKLVGELTSSNQQVRSITLAQALVKEQKMDYILQKATELGVTEIIPFCAERSIVKADKKDEKRKTRWEKIVKEASEQSKRTSLVKIHPILSFEELCQMDSYDVKIICSVSEKQKNLKKLLSNTPNSATMLFVIGPEGGLSDQEEQTLIENGFQRVSLGDTVLRTETAGLFIMSAVRYQDMG